jgi:hypothetical protein
MIGRWRYEGGDEYLHTFFQFFLISTKQYFFKKYYVCGMPSQNFFDKKKKKLYVHCTKDKGLKCYKKKG